MEGSEEEEEVEGSEEEEEVEGPGRRRWKGRRRRRRWKGRGGGGGRVGGGGGGGRAGEEEEVEGPEEEEVRDIRLEQSISATHCVYSLPPIHPHTFTPSHSHIIPKSLEISDKLCFLVRSHSGKHSSLYQ